MRAGKCRVQLAVRAKSFSDTGDKIGLTEDGSASIQHKYLLNIRYGILEFIEAGAE
ncbi:MAG: hypothetical protein R2727_12435 [Bacteroidales bacterium]